MHLTLSMSIELALCGLLAVTLGYCIVLERRLTAVRKGQTDLKSVVDGLDAAISNAGASIRALKATASGAAETLDDRLARAGSLVDELTLLTASGERRFSRSSRVRLDENLPSGSIMSRLDTLRAAR